MSHRIRHLASAAVIAMVAALAPIVLAGPAQADEKACLAELKEDGFEGDEFEALCAAAAKGDAGECVTKMLDEDVDLVTAIRACGAAAHQGEGGQGQ